MYTCAGANSVPVCVSPQDREASKSNAVCWPFIAPCCGFIPSDAPSPLRTPEDSQTYEHISRSILPVSARPVSVCQLPTFSDVNPVQARKRAGRGKNPFLFAMLFEKNIEIFSDPNPSVLCVFSICLPPFRAWTGGSTAGATNPAGLPAVTGEASWTRGAGGEPATTNSAGAFRVTLAGSTTTNAVSGAGDVRLDFDASWSNPIYGASPTVMPASVDLPVCLYLGLRA